MIELVDVGNISNIPLTKEEFFGRQLPLAVFIFAFSLFFMIFYTVVLLAIRKDSDYKKFTAYRLMVHIGVADIIQLGVHFSAGVYILLSDEHYGILEMIIGAIMNGAWCTMLVLSILLNINRFVSIIFAFSSERIFSKSLTNVYIGLCWCCFLFFFGIDMSPLSREIYVVPLYTWHYEDGRPLSYLIRTVSNRLVLVEVVCSIICYGSIFTFIYFRHAILSKKEMYLTIQVLSLGAFHVLCFLLWEYWFLGDSPFETFLGHFVWMFWNAISPVLHVTISPRIRADVSNYLGIRRASSIGVLSVVPQGSISSPVRSSVSRHG